MSAICHVEVDVIMVDPMSRNPIVSFVVPPIGFALGPPILIVEVINTDPIC